MIGVIAPLSRSEVVREFFELFKTSWEFYRAGQYYDVVICADPDASEIPRAKLVVMYGGQQLAFDSTAKIHACASSAAPRMLATDRVRFPVYGLSVLFDRCDGILVDEASQLSAGFLEAGGNRVLARIGYDLFHEVTFLLTEGQPLANAAIPTLDLHISFLRDLILRCEIPLREIPPVPRGYRFIACLTHDVDHPSVRLHKFDHTMLGFLYRAFAGSLIEVARRRGGLRRLFQNWAAILKLPFVHLRLLPDFWNQLQAYAALEGDGVRSSFFVIPFKKCRGEKRGGGVPHLRASAYGAAEIGNEIGVLVASGHEIGLHGIDSWHDSEKGSREIATIHKVTGRPVVGVRMHWLYFDRQTPALLESLGIEYDSTVGYNEAAGYRAGTSQVYRPLGLKQMLELPLHVMDTALFFPECQNLSFDEARSVVGKIVDHAAQNGGVVTINWHDRSIAPERLWGEFYSALMEELRSRGAWLANASDTVRWFRQRRAVAFRDIECELNPRIEADSNLPGMDVRVHDNSHRIGVPGSAETRA